MLCADLKVLSGRHQGKVISLTSRKFLIGRGEDCHMRPNNDLVSRHHCVFNLDEYSVRLRDLGSTNGTYVNDERIHGQVVLKTGDQIRIGKLELDITVKELAPVAAAEVIAAEPELEPEAVYEEFAQEAGQETMQDTGFLAESDTTFISPQQQPAPPLQYAPGVMPPGYGYPPQGYPGQPYMPQMPPGQYMYPYGQVPGGYPQYPMMPPGYPQYPGMPYPQQPMPQAGYPQGAAAYPVEEEAAPEDPKSEAKEMGVRLPDPSETGAKEVTPAAERPAPSADERAKNPSVMAQDLIQQYVRRRPGAS